MREFNQNIAGTANSLPGQIACMLPLPASGRQSHARTIWEGLFTADGAHKSCTNERGMAAGALNCEVQIILRSKKTHISPCFSRLTSMPR